MTINKWYMPGLVLSAIFGSSYMLGCTSYTAMSQFHTWQLLSTSVRNLLGVDLKILSIRKEVVFSV